jgi:prepilin-type N-terminal cleavage/methylation domain-containing protein
MRRVANRQAALLTSYWRGAFTLIELLVVIAVLAMLAVALAPALAKSGGKSGRVNCFNNKRQMAAACALYTAEWNDWLVPNAPAGFNFGWCNSGSENWGANAANTTSTFYTTNCIWPYVKDLKAYKCPNDRILSSNGDRIRSISMSGAICGDIPTLRSQLQSFLGAYRLYSKTADLTTPGPANTWIFCDESMYSLNDGYLQPNVNSPGYPEVPAAYDLSGNCFSFADAHVEYRKWVWPGTASAGLRNCPYAYGATGSWGSSGADSDWLWLRQHSSAPN